MPPQVGSPAPRFRSIAYYRPTDQFKDVSLDDYKGRWLCLYFYPHDFSPLCPTEIAAFDQALGEFETRKCDLAACSCDSQYAHRAFCDANPQLRTIKHPMLADVTRRMTTDYGLLVPAQGFALRGVFLIDGAGVLQWSAVYGFTVGRSVTEVLRVLDALQTGDDCPCNWKKGDPTLKS